MKKEKISPEKYSEVLSGIRLENVRLNKSSLAFYDEKSKSGSIDLNFSDSYKMKLLEKEVVFVASFKLEGVKNDEKEEKVFTITGEFYLLYSKDDDIDIDSSFMDVFKETSLPHIIWPYFREYVQASTNRMGLPPLTLPVRNFNLKKK